MNEPQRLRSVDVLRGAVMIVMALDHVRDFFSSATVDPTDVAHTWPALFFTRWITHFCAPVFVFLAGTGAFLSVAGGRSKPEVARFLLTRGLWLVLLEHTIVRLGWSFQVTQPFLFFQVIWVIGLSMIVLAGLVFLPLRVIAAFGLVMIAAHDLLDRLDARVFAATGTLWRFLHLSGSVSLGGPFHAWVGYPCIPWIGVMAVGYAFGALLGGDADRRRRRLFALGVVATLGFVALRAANVYGDPRPWSPQPTATMTLLSFLDTSKYPPSLAYLLMTLGPSLLALAALDRTRAEGLLRPVLTFGRVPLFFYLVHLLVIHALVMAVGQLRYHEVRSELLGGPFGPHAPGWGFALPGVYAWWILVVLGLYPLCAWFAGVKARRKDAWLRFL